MSTPRPSMGDSLSGDITMQSILKIVETLHFQKLAEKEEHIQNLQDDYHRLERDHQELGQKYSDTRRLSNDEKVLHEETNQRKEQTMLVLQAKNKSLEAELTKAQQEIKSMLVKMSQIKSERDKANHIIRTLLNKPNSYSQSTGCQQHAHSNQIFESNNGELP